MPEATVVILDSSEWMRNGDYTPTRMQAQLEAAHLLCEAKGQQNPENSCAVVAMCGRAPKVMLTLTTDIGKVLSVTYDLAPSGGSADLVAALQLAQLALNHRQNRGHAQRIVAFVGSPLTHTPDELRGVATQLRQANIAVDLVSFGETEQNAAALNALFAAVNKGDTSHMLTVEPGAHLLTDRLVMSAIVQGGADGGAASVAAEVAATGGAGDVGFNPELDPELATVLRESMQEFQRLQEQHAPAPPASVPATAPLPPPAAAVATTTTTTSGPMDEDEELRRALEMSVMQTQPEQTAAAPAPAIAAAPQSVPAPAAPARADAMDVSDEQQMLEMALQLSMQEQQQQAAAAMKTPTPAAPAADEKNRPTPPPPPDFGELLGDQKFLSDLLSSLPGVNPADARIQDVVASIRGNKTKEEEEAAKKKKAEEDTQAQKKSEDESKK